MRNEIELIDVSLGERLLAGASLGHRIHEQLIAPVIARPVTQRILILSFRSAEYVTGSVLKAVWGKLHTESGVPAPSLVAHLCNDVQSEFVIYLLSQRAAGLEALEWNKNEVHTARLHGHLEEPAFSALAILGKYPGSTPPQLHAESGEQVSPTAWTNRLNELYRQGLALRQKSGRAWRFYPVAREVIDGRSI